MGATKLDMGLLERAYFYWDKPVDYAVDSTHTIQIYPISLTDSEIFLSCANIIAVDKNGIADPDVIRMSYFEFMLKTMLTDENNVLRFALLCKLCLHRQLAIAADDGGRYRLVGDDGLVISSKRFDDIRTIILHQNIIDYDDEYTDPELKAAIAESEKLKGRDLADISIERKMAIITAHTGISKQQQMEMTYRAHSVLFREVCGEVDFDNTWLVALYAGETKNLDHWIFRKKHGKLDGHIISTDDFAKSAGMSISQTEQI